MYTAAPRPERAIAPTDQPIMPIPTERAEILRVLSLTQEKYERAKANLSDLEESKLEFTESIENETSVITETVDAKEWGSIAARDREVKKAIAASGVIRSSTEALRDVNRYMVRAREDVSVFRHRMLTLRAALFDPEIAALFSDAVRGEG